MKYFININSQQELDKAKRKLAMKLHPDHNGHNENATDFIDMINEFNLLNNTFNTVINKTELTSKEKFQEEMKKMHEREAKFNKSENTVEVKWDIDTFIDNIKRRITFTTVIAFISLFIAYNFVSVPYNYIIYAVMWIILVKDMIMWNVQNFLFGFILTGLLSI